MTLTRHAAPCLAASLCMLTAHAVIAGDGPVPILRYTFDDQNNPTANSGSLGASADGAIGSGVSFVPFNAGFAIEKTSPIDSQVVVSGNENLFDIGDNDFTLRMTIQTDFDDPNAPGGRFIITKNEQGSNDNWAVIFRPDTGLVQFALAADGTTIFCLSCTPVNDGQPHTITAVRSGDRLGLYIDGVLESAGNLPAAFGSTADGNAFPVHIAGRDAPAGPTGGVNDEFVGIIDDIEVYDSALLIPGVASPADRAPPFGVFDFNDVVAYLTEFSAGDPEADLAPPMGVLDFNDVIAFLVAFSAGCP